MFITKFNFIWLMWYSMEKRVDKDFYILRMFLIYRAVETKNVLYLPKIITSIIDTLLYK